MSITKKFNKPDATNLAIALLFQSEQQWRGVADPERYLLMKTILLTLLILIMPAIVEAQQTNENWILEMEFPRLLREQVPQVQLRGSLGAVGTDKLGSSIMGRRSEIYTVQSSDGFIPDLVKTALDNWFKGDFPAVHSSSAGSQEVGFISHDWAYHHQESGIVGRLTIWFPDTNAKPMKMVVVIDERKSR